MINTVDVLNQASGWAVQTDLLSRGWGVEDMHLVGNWTGKQTQNNMNSTKFQHHNNWVAGAPLPTSGMKSMLVPW